MLGCYPKDDFISTCIFVGSLALRMIALFCYMLRKLSPRNSS